MKAKRFVAPVFGIVLLTGCGLKGHMPQFGTAATQPAPGTAATATAQAPPAAPYALAAQCAGPFVSFSLVNQGTAPLEVKREHFALVVPKTRKVVPYNQHSATIDLPKFELAPGERLDGRAWFKEVPSPTGNRLVYKPDGQGTYADVVGPPGV